MPCTMHSLHSIESNSLSAEKNEHNVPMAILQSQAKKQTKRQKKKEKKEMWAK